MEEFIQNENDDYEDFIKLPQPTQDQADRIAAYLNQDDFGLLELILEYMSKEAINKYFLKYPSQIDRQHQEYIDYDYVYDHLNDIKDKEERERILEDIEQHVPLKRDVAQR